MLMVRVFFHSFIFCVLFIESGDEALMMCICRAHNITLPLIKVLLRIFFIVSMTNFATTNDFIKEEHFSI